MLPKKKRLTKKSDFENLIKTGFKFSTPSFFVRYIFDKDQNKAKKTLNIAVSVGLKISSKATVRNRLRRQVFGALVRELKSTSLVRGTQILLVPKKEALFLKNAELSEEVKLLINKILKNG